MPLLMCPKKAYQKAELKLLFVGQQINNWGHYRLTPGNYQAWIKSLMSEYSEYFDLEKVRRTHFWEVIQSVNEKLKNGGKTVSCLWTNINKINQSKIVQKQYYKSTIEEFDKILQGEIKIVRPDLVLFLTGPSFDNKIKDIFKGVVYKKKGRFNLKEFAMLSHADLPDCSFRIYHPNYLIRFKNRRYKKVLRQISSTKIK